MAIDKRLIIGIGATMGISGILLIGFADSWLTALGVLLAFWGNNISQAVVVQK